MTSRQTSSDPFATLLTGDRSQTSSDSSTGSVRGIALRRELKKLFDKQPELFYNAVEASMLEECAPQTERPVFAPEWVKDRAVIGPGKPQIVWTWLMSLVHKYLQVGKHGHARALSALCLAMSEQTTLDGGDMTLAYLLTLQAGAPFSHI